MIAIDELSEVSEDAWNLLVSRLRFPGVPEEALQMVACSNPCSGWVKKRFIDFVDDNFYTVHLDITQNPYLPKTYIEDLKKSLPESQHGALIYGKWEDVAEINSLFEMNQIEEAMKRKGYKADEQVWAIDVGEYGSDDSVISRRSGTKIQIIKQVGKKSIPELARIIRKVIKDKEAQVVIDALGLGHGLVVLLEEWGYQNIIKFKGAERSYAPEQYANKKTEMYFELMDRIPEMSLPKSSRLRDEMEQTKYFTNSRGVIQVEGNRMRRKKGLASPNILDSISMLFSLEIDEDSEGLLKKMLAHMLAVTQKKGETRPGQKVKVKTVATIGRVTGKPAKKLPKEFTQKEMVNKSEEEIFDNFAESRGYQRHIPVRK